MPSCYLPLLKIIHIPFCLLVPAILLYACQSNNQDTGTLTIATAANMAYAIEPITAAFTQSTGILCKTVVGSSGKLTAQIKAGAPYHVLVSADMQYPFALYQSGHATSPPIPYAYGQLVLWSMVEGTPVEITDLTQTQIKHIAIANPKTAPYGKAALEALTQMGLAQQVDKKLVYGESIAQTNQFIRSKAVEVGFTSKSAVLAASNQGYGAWATIADTLYTPITQGLVVLAACKGTPIENHAIQFISFMQTAQARDILQQSGYQVTKAPALNVMP